MKIKLTSSKFLENRGKVVEVEHADDSGDVNLGEGAYEIYGYSWAFKGEYEEVSEAEVTAKYTLTIPVQHLIELYEILVGLPEEVLMAAKLTNN